MFSPLPPPYPFDVFLRHFQEHSALRTTDKPASFDAGLAQLLVYLEPQYPDDEQRTYVALRYLLIIQYLARHMRELDEADFAVFGSEKEGALVADHLLRALHHFFTTRPLSMLEDGPSPQEVMELAATMRELDTGDGNAA